MNRIKELRLSKGWSQQEFANALQIHQTAISQWETGKTNPNTTQALVVAKLFSVSIDYLLGNADEPNLILPTKKAPPDEQMALFLKQKLNSLGIGAPDRDLTDEELKALLEIARNNKDFIVWRAKQLAEDRDK